MTTRRGGRAGSLVAGLAAAVAASGCASSAPGPRVEAAITAGEYGTAREFLFTHMEQDREERNFILDRMRLSIATLADGYPDSAEIPANELFQLLRTQGVNQDKTVAAAIFVDDVLIWKGEPFEQALGYYYIALQKAMIGDWGNARAAAQGSLFLLKDFGENMLGNRLSTEEIARRALRHDQRAGAEGEGDGDYLDHGYQPIETNFALGYLMSGLASQALGRAEEASDNYRKAVRYNQGLRQVTEALLAGATNTVLIVEAGWGPEKVRYGMDGAFSRFQPRWPSDDPPVFAQVSGGSSEAVGCACDVNTLAQDHMWNNMEDVRVAKSRIGTGLMGAGAIVSATSNSEGAQWAGLGMILAGALMKASSRADVRYNDLLPQAVYVVGLSVASDDSTIELSVSDNPAWLLALPAIDPPPAFQVLYARVPPSPSPLGWAQSGAVFYANDEYGRQVEGGDLPFILGGRCVRSPSPRVLEEYQRAGWLRDVTINDLENLYREEGLAWTIEDQGGFAGRHVLEGGRSLVCPRPGSAGYARVFGQLHEPYRPRSHWCKELASEIAAQRP